MYVRQWDFRQDWLDWVDQNWQGTGRVELTYNECPERDFFAQKCRESFTDFGVKVKNLKTYFCVQSYEDGDGYIDGHPHFHHPINAYTLVHYLKVDEDSAKLDIFNKGSVVKTIIPKPGLTVFFKNSVIHGVHKHKGKDKRIALIATALV